MNPALADLHRLIANMIRIGTVSAVRSGACRVKTGEIETDWRPYLVPRSGATRRRARPTLGEQVLLLCMSGDLATAYVLPAVHQDAHPEPAASDDNPDLDRIEYPDGAVLEYNPKTSALTASGIKTANITASTSVTLTTPLVECTRALKVGTTIEAGSTITAGGKVTAPSATIGGIEVTTHKHGGVSTGSGQTGGPQ